ncbi:MAG: alpha/beta hydrolase [Paracoccaceae bacterium]
MSNPYLPSAITGETAFFNAKLAKLLEGTAPPQEMPVELTRQLRAAGQGIFPLGGPRDSGRWREIPGADGRRARVRVTDPPNGTPRRTYMHLHGGGWTFNAPEQYDRANARIATGAATRVVSVEYRLGPEHRWPACGEDALAAAIWVLDSFPGPVAIGGESAGAHLALVTLMRLRGHTDFHRIHGATLLYGMYDLRGTPSLRNWGTRYLVLNTPVVDWFVGNLMGDGDRGDPSASPLLGDLSGLPPVLIIVGTADPLLDDSLFLEARLRAAGGRADLMVVPGGVHAFDQFDDLPVAQEARARQLAFLVEALR